MAGLLLPKVTLPKYHGGRVETLAKLYTRACTAFKVPADDTGPKCTAMIGSGMGQGF